MARPRENCLGQKGLERYGCGPGPPGGLKVKKKNLVGRGQK